MGDTPTTFPTEEHTMRKIKFAAVAAALAVAATAAVPAMASASTRVCRQGDPPITVSAVTSCAFAGNVVTYAYQGTGSGCCARIYSPVTRRSYWVRFWTHWYSPSAAIITATGPNGIWLRFDYVN